MNNTIIKLLKEFAQHKAKLGIVMVAIGCVSASMLSVGHILRSLIDNGIVAGNMSALNHSLLQMIFAVLTLGIGSFFRSYYINHISSQVISSIRIRVYKSLLKKPLEYFDYIKTSDCLGRFTYDLTLIGELITNILSFSIRNTFMIVGGIVMMFTQNFKLTLITIMTFPVIMVCLSVMVVRIKKYARGVSEDKVSLEEIINETLMNIKMVYGLNIEDYRITKLITQSRLHNANTKKYLKFRALFFASAISSIAFAMLLVIWMGGKDVLEGNISSGNIVSFIFYALLTAFAIGGVAEVFGDMQKYLTGAARVFEMEDGAAREAISSVKIDALYSLSFSIKHFSYPTRPDIQVLKNIAFDIKPGEFFGVVGSSGSGKSTILQLIMGIYTAPDCHIRINGREVRLDLDQELRSKISYIPQDPHLFSTTIEENITVGRDFGPLDNVIKVCGLSSMLESLPKGIKTYVGERGAQLSGGQKQRIAIARSIYGNPEILLMDEATSALDTKSEIALLSRLRKHMNGKIIISIAHRLSSIKDADNIILMQNGEIVAIDSHQKLLEIAPLYATLNRE